VNDFKRHEWIAIWIMVIVLIGLFAYGFVVMLLL
jgi:hypothetical protein